MSKSSKPPKVPAAPPQRDRPTSKSSEELPGASVLRDPRREKQRGPQLDAPTPSFRRPPSVSESMPLGFEPRPITAVSAPRAVEQSRDDVATVEVDVVDVVDVVDADDTVNTEFADEAATPLSLSDSLGTTTSVAGPSPRATVLPIAHGEALMANNIKEMLTELSGVDGFIAAAVADSDSGMALGTAGGGANFNVDMAAAANTEVVKAKGRAMKSLKLDDAIEDILITLGAQYHIIRPLSSRPTVFFYIAVDRDKANLALARFALAEAESKLKLS